MHVDQTSLEIVGGYEKWWSWDTKPESHIKSYIIHSWENKYTIGLFHNY
jgi:hypothetical protein